MRKCYKRILGITLLLLTIYLLCLFLGFLVAPATEIPAFTFAFYLMLGIGGAILFFLGVVAIAGLIHYLLS